jgi:2-polyprenyl-6-methoxyphenol hydroxylase-like FAD-dependent oxidoreductase
MSGQRDLGVVVVGGGIAGLAFALSLHQRGIACDVYESVPQVKELGVGITLLPHGMRELSALGVQPQIEAAGIEKVCFSAATASTSTASRAAAMLATLCPRLVSTAAGCTASCLKRRCSAWAPIGSTPAIAAPA